MNFGREVSILEHINLGPKHNPSYLKYVYFQALKLKRQIEFYSRLAEQIASFSNFPFIVAKTLKSLCKKPFGEMTALLKVIKYKNNINIVILANAYSFVKIKMVKKFRVIESQKKHVIRL
tara:strand:- start:212 stop:571 length:360 start_codon:yes stop_codon:yes gene_type:complete